MAKYRAGGNRLIKRGRTGTAIRDSNIKVTYQLSDPGKNKVGATIGVMACVTMGGKGKRAYSSVVCENGPNPRKALSKALHRFATNIGNRKGALAGLK